MVARPSAIDAGWPRETSNLLKWILELDAWWEARTQILNPIRELGFTENDHLVPDDEAKPYPKFPYKVTRLHDSKGVFNPEKFAAIKNTITMIKLALLDGDGLNQVIAESGVPSATCLRLYPTQKPLAAECAAVQVSAISGFGSDHRIPANIMINSHPSTSDSSPIRLWLRSIDSDHAWRKDGLPRFCDTPTLSTPCRRLGSTPVSERPHGENGGNGTFPLWRSCAGRDVFRILFHDWETPAQPYQPFPDYGDQCDKP